MQGGAGVVLQGAADGDDWLVRKAWQMHGVGFIEVWDMRLRGSVRQFGKR